MKKIISFALMVSILLSLSALAMEDFTLHNGTKFGMSKQEIVDIEAKYGFALTIDQYDEYGGVFGNGRVANFDCHVSYKCPEDSMIGLIYDFKHWKEGSLDYSDYVTRFETIEEGLIQKYGPTDYTSQTGFSFPTVGEFGNTFQDDYPFCGGKDVTGSVFDHEAIREEYSHRLIELSDGSYVLIDHVIYSYRSLSSLNKGYNHQLQYKLLTEEEAQIIRQSMNDFTNDL